MGNFARSLGLAGKMTNTMEQNWGPIMVRLEGRHASAAEDSGVNLPAPPPCDGTLVVAVLSCSFHLDPSAAAAGAWAKLSLGGDPATQETKVAARSAESCEFDQTFRFPLHGAQTRSQCPSNAWRPWFHLKPTRAYSKADHLRFLVACICLCRRWRLLRGIHTSRRYLGQAAQNTPHIRCVPWAGDCTAAGGTALHRPASPRLQARALTRL